MEFPETPRTTEFDQPGTGPFYAYDNPTIERADLHGCLNEDVETGDPIVCRECAYPSEQPDG